VQAGLEPDWTRGGTGRVQHRLRVAWLPVCGRRESGTKWGGYAASATGSTR